MEKESTSKINIGRTKIEKSQSLHGAKFSDVYLVLAGFK